MLVYRKLFKNHNTFKSSIFLRKYHCKSKYFLLRIMYVSALTIGLYICQDNLGYDVTMIQTPQQKFISSPCSVLIRIDWDPAACCLQSWTHANRTSLRLHRTIIVIERKRSVLTHKLCRQATHNGKSKSHVHT